MWNSQTESDLKCALAARLWEGLEVNIFTISEDLTAREDRLDTARLLINAGSDIDFISFPALLNWATEWDFETILSVVGNYDNFHWDVIQLGLYSSD